MKIAIQGHPTRGKEIIEIFKSLGGINDGLHEGNNPDCYYELHGNLIWCVSTKGINFKYCTLEEFEKEFPFKIGDEVIFPVKVGWLSGKITGLIYVEDQLKYKVYTRIGGYHYMDPHKLSLYPMKKERNITLTFDKAKEWYQKGGELKEVALQAFSEKELNPLPRSWEEFVTNRARMGYYISADGKPLMCASSGKLSSPHVCPSKKSAEAHLAMIQLEQLRDCWRQSWEPIWDISEKWCIRLWGNELDIGITTNISRFLTFPTKEMAEEFLKCFRDLIEIARDFI